MEIIFKIAWRNVWRNPRRSWVLMTSIAVGVLGYLGTTSFSRGFLEQMVEASINLHGGDIMIAAKGYHENPNIRMYMKQPERIADVLKKIDRLDYAPLVSFPGMINSSEKASGVVINGVIPKQEAKITVVPNSITQGRYLDGNNGERQMVLGEELAGHLNVRLGEKVVLMTSDLENNINAGAYRIVGLYRTVSPDFDKAYVYLHQSAAQRLAGYENAVNAFTARVDQSLNLEAVMKELQSRLSSDRVEILSWKDRNPLLVLSMDLYEYSLVLIGILLFIAIAFSIANSFLMVIYERIYEFGIMMANGVHPKKIRHMLYTEAFFMTVIGMLVGFVVSVGILGYLGRVGLDLSAFAQGLSKFGVGALVYPEIATLDVTIGVLVIILIVAMSVLYPAIKASRFEVVDAIRFV